MFIAELSHPDFLTYDLSSLRTGLMAGSPCPVEVMKQVKTAMHMPEVEIAYGMTETSPVSFQTRVGAPLEKQVGTVGRVQSARNRSQDHRPCHRPYRSGRRLGGAMHSRHSVMLGYSEQSPAPRTEAIDAARWMHTGDLATLDAEGYANIVGRIKDMIIRGGENVYPREIEEFLYTHPKVQDAGDRRARCEVRRGGHGLGQGARRRRRDPRRDPRVLPGPIAHYKIPRYIKFVDAFPMTVTGKIQKFIMRDESVKELGVGSGRGR